LSHLNFLKFIFKKLPFIRKVAVKFFYIYYIKIHARKHKLKVKSSKFYFEFHSLDGTAIRLSKRHLVYGQDIVESFEYYFSAVESLLVDSIKLVDYSVPKYHDVVGFDKHPIFFPSLAEPLVTTYQYLDFANIKDSDVVLDLGAYSGLTSIIFKEKAGKNGKVIAVDADKHNFLAMEKNFSLYQRVTGNTIDFLNKAIWIHDNGLQFSQEGNMGSSASEIVGNFRGDIEFVPSLKLSSISNFYGLEKINFIKCDIEGAESVIFEDKIFFKKHLPRIIVEVHFVDNIETTEKVIFDLSQHGYTFKRITQTGVVLPLLECYPPV
jgi:FkbM family methyltransferase